MSERRIVVDPVTRIEGHLRVQATLGDDGRIADSMSTGTMWRGLEVILKGRDPRDAWAFVERICGVCTGIHALAAVRSVEDALGSRSRRTPTSCATWSMPRSTCTTIWCTSISSPRSTGSTWSRRLSRSPRNRGDPAENLPESSACLRGLLPRRPEPPEEVRRERPARIFKNGYWAIRP